MRIERTNPLAAGQGIQPIIANTLLNQQPIDMETNAQKISPDLIKKVADNRSVYELQ
jgi:hypothetical protein